MTDFDLLSTNELEIQVQERIAELEKANQELRAEILERKRAEGLFRYQANLVDNVSDAIISTDKEMKIQSWNKAAERMYGWQADEVIGLKGSDVLHTTFPEELSREAITKDIFEKGHWEGDLIQRTKDGRDIIVYAKSMALKDEAGVVIGGVSISSDITDRKRADEALRENQEDFDRAQAVGNIGSWRLDVRKNELTWSDENHRIFGIPKGVPLTYETFLSTVHPDDREYVDEKWKAGLAGEPYDIEHRIITDGKIKWVREKAYLEFDKAGALLGGFGITQDTTERKRAEDALRESEERYRTLFNTMDEGFCIIEVLFDKNEKPIDYTFVETNPAFEKQTGLDNAVGKRIRELAPENEEYWYERYGRVALTGESVRFENRAEALHRWYEVYAYRIGQPESRKVAILFNDINERKLTEKTLRQAYENIQMQSEELQVANEELRAQSEELHEAYEKLWESKESERARFEELALLLDAVPAAVWIAHDPQALNITGNKLSYEWLQIPEGANASKSAPEGERPETFRMFKDGLEILPVDMPVEMSARGTEILNYDFDFVYPDGRVRHVLGNAEPLHDKQGNPCGSVSAFIDITELRQAEEALKIAYDSLEAKVNERTAELEKAYNSLKESEKGLAEAQKIAHLGNWDWNPVTDEVYWSNEMYRIFRVDPLEFGATYDAFLNYVHPEDRDYVDNSFKETLSGKPNDIDYRVILANGEERIVHAMGKVVFDEKGKPIRVKGTTQDITERIKAEEKIQTLANVVESSNDAIATESLEGVIFSWNKGAEQIYGYSAEEVIGKPISILDPLMLVGETVELAELIKQGDKIHNYETLRLRKDGTIINVSLTLSPVYDASGELTAISVVARNITKSKNTEKELQQSEERYRIVTEQTGQMVYDYDLKTNKNKWAGAIEEVTGYNFEEFQKLGKDFWTENILDSDPNRVYEKFQDKKIGDRFKEKLRLRRKDGTYGYIENSGVYLMDNDSQPYRAIGVLRDITEEREAEEALKKIDKMRIKEIHHRIKNNLQVISSLLDLQAEKFEDETVKKAFVESQDRVVSMALIHEELYNGEGTHTDTLDFSAYLQKLAQNLFQTYSLRSKNIRLCTDLEENAFFDMDTAVPLGIVVNELVSNSLKHAFQGKDNGEIRIKLHKEESKRGDCKSVSFILTVSDNGIGIPENLEIEKLDSLGMQLVTTLVDQLYGELELKRDNGTEFIIRFTVKEG